MQTRCGRSGVALTIAELREIDEVRDDDGGKAELAEHVDEIAGGRDDLVDAGEHKLTGAEALEMVTGFAAAVVDDRLFAAALCEPPGRGRCEQKRPVGRGENVRDVYVFETPPKMPEVDGLAEDRAESGNALRPG